MNHLTDTLTTSAEQPGILGRHVHICTITPDQTVDADIVRKWLQEHRCTVMVDPHEPLEAKLSAAWDCDLCLLLLGPTFLEPRVTGNDEPPSSFSDTELEVSVAADVHAGKVVVFARSDTESTLSAEQREFVARVGNFAQGAFYSRYPTVTEIKQESPGATEEQLQATFRARLRNILDETLTKWQQPQSLIAARPHAVASDAFMISSTGDPVVKNYRAAVRLVLEEDGIPVIDYLHEPSEAVTPVDRVISWVRNCHVLLLILDERYGYVSPLDGLGATELEFVTALEAPRPILVLVFIGPHAEKTTDIDQQQFIERVRSLVPHRQIFTFLETADLQQQLRLELTKLDHIHVPTTVPTVEDTTRLRWYRRQVERWLGVIPHPLRAEGMPLDQIYISLGLSRAQSSADRQVEDESHKGNILDADDESHKGNTLDADKALERFSRLVLQGDPGMGKSVALRWYAINAAENIVPIYIRLSAYARARERGEVETIEDYVRQEEQRLALGSPEGESLWMAYLRSGRGLLLLDGLDEVSSHATDSAFYESPRAGVIRNILALAADLPTTTPIVIATRSQDGNAGLLAPAFTTLHVQPLTLPQQRRLVLQWLHTSHREFPFAAVQTSLRVFDVLQAQDHVKSWAASPLMLTLLTALVDNAGDAFKGEDLSKAILLRRAMRFLLGQWSTLATREEDNLIEKRRLGGRRLWLKELLLYRLAWNSFLAHRRQIISEDDVRSAWQTLPMLAQAMSDETTALAELSSEEGFLLQVGEGEYSFYHPIFQEYLSAARITALGAEERAGLVAAKRLDAGWEETMQLLVAELDRLNCPDDADKILITLCEMDQRPVPSHSWTDPLHLSLSRAARCHGLRVAAATREEPGRSIAQAWERVFLDNVVGERIQLLQDKACQAFLAMGPAAEYAQTALRVAIDLKEPPPTAIEALGNIRTSEMNDLLRAILERSDGNGETQVAALRGLQHLGLDAVRPYRDLLSRISYYADGSWAAALLIQLNPTQQELMGIARRREELRLEALWAIPLLPSDDAIPMLRQVLNQSSVFAQRLRDGHLLDFTGDRDIDDRYIALAATVRLGMHAKPLLGDIIYRSVWDTPRNRDRAQDIVLSFGTEAVSELRQKIDKHCRNEVLQAQYFGEILAGLDQATDAHEIKRLVKEGIAMLRHIAVLKDQQGRAFSENVSQQPTAEERWVDAVRQSYGLAAAYEIRHIPPLKENEIYREAVIGTLRAILRHESDKGEDAYEATLDVIARLGKGAETLLGDLQQVAQEPRYRQKILTVFVKLGSTSASALPFLRAALADPDWVVQARAADAIGSLGNAAAPAIEDLSAQVSDRTNAARGQYRVRRSAIVALAQLWPLSAEALPVILQSLANDPVADVRVEAAQALGQIGNPDVLVLDALHTALADQGAGINGKVSDRALIALEILLQRLDEEKEMIFVSGDTSVRPGVLPTTVAQQSARKFGLWSLLRGRNRVSD